MRVNIIYLHIITSTDIGGAETSLFNLLRATDRDRFTQRVISLAPLGPIAEKIQALGVEVRTLNMSANRFDPMAILRLARMVREANPALVHCWMYHANLLGGLAAALAGVPVIWAIHHHSIDKTLLKKSTILIIKLGAFFSRLIPTKIIYCSQSAQEAHVQIGYSKKKALVIPNGFDTDYFKPDEAARSTFRRGLAIPRDSVLIGHAARFDPTKDHQTFIQAAGTLLNFLPNAYFVLCGRGVDYENTAIKKWIQAAGIEDHAVLLGELIDLREFYAALDIFVLSSISEAFPNVIGEAMSCGVPCVVTNVGDSALLVGEAGLVVSPKDPPSLARAMLELLENEKRRRELGQKARERIMHNYTIERIVAEYDKLLS